MEEGQGCLIWFKEGRAIYSGLLSRAGFLPRWAYAASPKRRQLGPVESAAAQLPDVRLFLRRGLRAGVPGALTSPYRRNIPRATLPYRSYVFFIIASPTTRL